MSGPTYVLNRDWYTYTSDDGNPYVVATTQDNGSVNTGATPINPEDHPTYPRGFVMRRILGEFVDNGVIYRTHVPIFDPTAALWVGTTSSFTKGGKSFNVTGRIGERRVHKGG